MVYNVEHVMMDSDNTATTCVIKQPDRAFDSPLSAIAEAFDKLAKRLDENDTDDDTNHGSAKQDIRLDTFCNTCALVSVLFNCLGLAFRFAELEYVAKLEGLLEASKTCGTLNDVIDLDVASHTVKSSGSCSRHLRRVRQGIDLVKAIFELLLSSDDNSLKEIATIAYGRVCAPYHSWAVRTAVYAGMYTLPTRDQLFLRLNETEQSAEKKMRRYIDASLAIIEYIDKLYLSRDIVLDW